MGFFDRMQYRISSSLGGAAAIRSGRCALVAVALLAFNLSAGAASPVEREYEQAVRSFRAGRLSDAFGRFVDLANRGDVDSARIALFLQSYGPVLYGKDWDAGPDNVAYWNLLIRNSGTSARPLPEYPATLLTPGKKPRTLPPRSVGTQGLANVAGE
jgi:hypothetical protein